MILTRTGLRYRPYRFYLRCVERSMRSRIIRLRTYESAVCVVVGLAK